MPMKANLGENLLKNNLSKADPLNDKVINTVWEGMRSRLVAINCVSIYNFISFVVAHFLEFLLSDFILDSNKH